MDQVTQQNAAMVEQSTAASHALMQEAEELSQLTSRFQLGGEGGSGHEPARAAPRRPAAEAPRPRKPAPAVREPARKLATAGDGDGWTVF